MDRAIPSPTLCSGDGRKCRYFQLRIILFNATTSAAKKRGSLEGEIQIIMRNWTEVRMQRLERRKKLFKSRTGNSQTFPGAYGTFSDTVCLHSSCPSSTLQEETRNPKPAATSSFLLPPARRKKPQSLIQAAPQPRLPWTKHSSLRSFCKENNPKIIPEPNPTHKTSF